MNILKMVGLTSLRRAKAAPAAVPWTQEASPSQPAPPPASAARPSLYLRGIRSALLALVLAGVLLWSPPADAQTATVVTVKNTGQTLAGAFPHILNTRDKLAQAFTTADGSNAQLDSVGIRFGGITNTGTAASKLTLAIYEESSNEPGGLHCTLSHPQSYSANAVNYYGASNCDPLDEDTTYFVVLDNNDVSNFFAQWGATASDSEDSDPAPGWSIANVGRIQFDDGGTPTWGDFDSSNAFMLEILADNRPATGEPRVLASAEGPGVLFADTSGIADEDGFYHTGAFIDPRRSYQWIRVDGGNETLVGDDSRNYHLVDNDVGKLIKVRVSVTDAIGSTESRTSEEFGPVRAPSDRDPSRPVTTLVSNTGQSHSVNAALTGQYVTGFKLGTHGQGYEISSVLIDLGSTPSSLKVSLWIGGIPGQSHADSRRYKLFDFTNPDSLEIGLNRFTAPSWAFAYPNVNYFVVLSDFGAEITIKETSSDAEDPGGEPGATLSDMAGSRVNVLRMAVEGSRRDRGILASNYAQPGQGDQEIISVGDEYAWRMDVGAADRYLIRGFSFYADNTSAAGGFTNRYDLLSGTTKLFSLHYSRNVPGINLWSAPQGATVAGGGAYDFDQDVTKDPDNREGSVLVRTWAPAAPGNDAPTAPGVTLSVTPGGDATLPDGTAPYMAVLGEPLNALVSNLEQTDGGTIALGPSDARVASQGFTTGSDPYGFRLRGIGVNIEGSGAQLPDGPRQVSVAVHADSNGKPGEKLFDLISPTEYAAASLSFFEAPPGATLAPNTSYVMVWHYLGGSRWHSLQGTSSDSEDAGAVSGSRIADVVYVGADLNNLIAFRGGIALEMAVYSNYLPATTPLVEVIEPTDATSVLVSNKGESSSTLLEFDSQVTAFAQEFTTGGADRGYKVTSVGFRFTLITQRHQLGPNLTASINAKSGNDPGDVHCELANPATFFSNRFNYFTARNCTLPPETDYFIVIERSAGASGTTEVSTTLSRAEHGEADWSIANRRHGYRFGWSSSTQSNFMIDIKGGAQQPPSDDTSPRNLAAYAIDGGVALRWLEPMEDAASVDGYEILRRRPNQSEKVLATLVRDTGGTATNFTDHTATETGVRYTYRVRAIRDSETSPWSNYASVVPLDQAPALALVSNLGQTPASAATVTKQYAIRVKLGTHGQGYEISDVTIDLAARPSSLDVSLWISGPPNTATGVGVPQEKVFDFANPTSFKVGRNKFTAPAGTLAYPGVNYWVVLSGFGSSLEIVQTSSDAEDARKTPGAEIGDSALERTLGTTGPWHTQEWRSATSISDFHDAGAPAPTTRGNSLRLAVAGAKRDRGILASVFGQPKNGQEIISVGDKCCFTMTVGAADRFLIRGLALAADDSTSRSGFFGLPFELHDSSDTKLFDLPFASARSYIAVATPDKLSGPPGINEWTAPQGATVAGNSTATLRMDIKGITGDIAGSTRGGVVLGRVYSHDPDPDNDPATPPIGPGYDQPTAPGVTFTGYEDVSIDNPIMAVLGIPLHAMVSNLGQTDDGFANLGDTTRRAVSQAFTTGSNLTGYRLDGIGFNLSGISDDVRVPTGPSAVSVAVHEESNGKPGAKLFDLVSPDEYAKGTHSFFEAPPGTSLDADTTYVVVWRYLSGTWHHLLTNSTLNEDPGALTRFSIDGVHLEGPDLAGLTAATGSKSLEIAVYGEAKEQVSNYGYPVKPDWLHLPPDVRIGDQFRLLFVTHHAVEATSTDIGFYDDLVQFEAAGKTKRYPTSSITNAVIRKLAPEFRAVVCTENVDARTHTGMTDSVGVPIHWLDGGWEDRPTLIANTYDEFYSGTWLNADKGAIVTGNSRTFGEHTTVWTGCNHDGLTHPDFPLGSSMGMAIVGTPGRDPASFPPLGPSDPNNQVTRETNEIDWLYAISPIFIVVP